MLTIRFRRGAEIRTTSLLSSLCIVMCRTCIRLTVQGRCSRARVGIPVTFVELIRYGRALLVDYVTTLRTFGTCVCMF